MCVHILGGHKEGVHDVSIHPSGKCALSVSKDQTMRLWNLVEGLLVLLFVQCHFFILLVHRPMLIYS